MRLPTLFLAGVLLIAVFNIALSVQRQWQLRVLPPALSEIRPTSTFTARLDAVTDPAELRRIALARHQALLASDHVTQGLLGTVRTISLSDSIQSSLVFLLALGTCFFDRRPRVAGNVRAEHPA